MVARPQMPYEAWMSNISGDWMEGVVDPDLQKVFNLPWIQSDVPQNAKGEKYRILNSL